MAVLAGVMYSAAAVTASSPATVVAALVAAVAPLPRVTVVLPVLSSGELVATPLHSESWPAVDVAPLSAKEALVIPPGLLA